LLEEGLSEPLGSYATIAEGATDEWLTPPELVTRLGVFDLDPCAAPEPKAFVHALENWNLSDKDGLQEPWFGRVWLNPPYGRDTQKWITKLVDHGNGMLLVFDVLADDGSLRTNADGSAVTPETLYSEFHGSHPWAIRGRTLSGGGGTSSSGSGIRPPTYELTTLFGPGSSAQLANKLSIQQPAEYKRLRAEAVKIGLVAGRN